MYLENAFSCIPETEKRLVCSQDLNSGVHLNSQPKSKILNMYVALFIALEHVFCIFRKATRQYMYCTAILCTISAFFHEHEKRHDA